MKVDLHYLPAHIYTHIYIFFVRSFVDGTTPRCYPVWGAEQEAQPVGCFVALRPGEAQPEPRSRLSGLNGLGWEERMNIAE